MDFKQHFQHPFRKWGICAFWCIIYILFIIWVGNPWWFLLLPVIIDMVVTKFIPWDAWKKVKNPVLRRIFSWIDAIVFALVAVYFINLYLFQNYQIPSSSLEKTLLVGDFLFVSKAAYGPRVPNTPLSFPLVQNTFPWGGKSYFEKPSWPYRRLKGLHEVNRNDIVVFNFPAGDSLPSNVSNPDYYTLCYQASIGAMPINEGQVMSWSEYQQRMSNGKNWIHQHKGQFGEMIWRPVDHRECYVKRCVALPGETLEIKNNIIFINGEQQPEPEHVQYAYYVQTDGTPIDRRLLLKLDIRSDEATEIFNDGLKRFLNIGVDTIGNQIGKVYRVTLTKNTLDQMKKIPFVKKVIIEPDIPDSYQCVFPLPFSQKWTRDNYGPLYIPQRGATIKLTEENVLKYERCITAYEGNTLEFKNGTAFVNGEVATEYTFQQNYYWMMGDNRHNSADSRMWGFVPEDHIIGRPVFVWLSLDPERKFSEGKLRYKRLFKNAMR